MSGWMPDLLERCHDVVADTSATNPGRQPHEKSQGGSQGADNQHDRQKLIHQPKLARVGRRAIYVPVGGPRIGHQGARMVARFLP